MKKWQKVLIIIACIITVLFVAGVIVYKVYLAPVIDDKIGDVAVKMSQIINDESFQSQIDEMAQSMMDDGVIKPEDVPTYNKMKLENEAKRREDEEAAQRIVEQIVAEDEGKKGNTVKTPKPEKTPTEEAPQNVVKEEKKETPAPLTKKTLMERLKAAMTADEFSFALSMYRRIDLGYAQSLLKTDRAAAKEYIYSKASPAEISRALEIYAKYSYLLK